MDFFISIIKLQGSKFYIDIYQGEVLTFRINFRTKMKYEES